MLFRETTRRDVSPQVSARPVDGMKSYMGAPSGGDEAGPANSASGSLVDVEPFNELVASLPSTKAYASKWREQ
jgi:hypothetical protein